MRCFEFFARLFADDTPDHPAGVWVNEFWTITLKADGSMSETQGAYSRWRVSGSDEMYFSGRMGEVGLIYGYNEQTGVLVLSSVDPHAISVFRRTDSVDWEA
ncbi:MAG: hypothetical protein IH945_02065 [Armatimonadetes bacterium]|nr:hypothetical protein [Armatimonadota bacterium]